MMIDYEREGDEAGIDEVVCRAFGAMSEAYLVRMMRDTHPAFDPQWSIVAREEGRITGHVLFTPARLRLMGRTIRALAVGPVATLPDLQKRGIAAALLRAGHDHGRAQGYELCFLFGHPTYYPRLGYRPTFGFAQVTIQVDRLPKPTQLLQARPVVAGDVPWLVDRHAAELADVDFGWLWGDHLNEWRLPPTNGMIWETADGQRAAYTVASPGRPWGAPAKCDLLLAEDPTLAREVLATIRPESLPHHPGGWLARHVIHSEWATASVTASDAGMALELKPGVLDAYRAAVAGGRPVGAPRFPLVFLAV